MQWKISRTYDKWLVRDYLLHVRAFSKRLLKDVKNDGAILLNGSPVNVRQRVSYGDFLIVNLPNESGSKYVEPEKMQLSIIYEDEHYLLVNKPRGMAVSPNMNDEGGTLANGLMYHFFQKGLPYTIHIVNRLDRYTSGVVLVAKHRLAHHLMQISEVDRLYLAIVQGTRLEKRGTIDEPIARNLPSIIERKVSTEGKRAVTHYEVVEEKNDYTLVRINLETGKTHQIRVHFSHIGYPLIGDDLYGGPIELLKGQALHCRSIRFFHPYHKQWISGYASLPKEIKHIVEK
ncbi:RNA pseudouridine synthase [Halalkalibacillus sediminis]|uniref:Pseudouridine synthase n=1 Tax=Halalkalibacillus sediminis TaxID=2018042 RepID=A0A2I0QVJ7_9BACI|nr:RluA family pseudouridine synthase [Halalkalibacillus sediminis]PKR78356.1 RNA pseudouridine synthase [Halalkalibacillus sediminis]